MNPIADQGSLNRIKDNIAPSDLKSFDQNIESIQKKYPEIGNDMIEIELLSTIIKDLESPVRQGLFMALTMELLKVSKPGAAFHSLAEIKRALQGLPIESQKLLIKNMISNQKGLKLDHDLYRATRINLEMLEN